MLRKTGKSVAQATAALKSQPTAFKNELLFQQGINFNDQPAWQRRGVGLTWEIYEKAGYDPIQSKAVTARRRRVKIDEELPIKEEYAAFIQHLLDANQPMKDQ